MDEFNNKDVLVMKLLHYFITEENYNPVVLRGSSKWNMAWKYEL